MADVKIKVIDSDKLVKAINEGSYDVNLSSVMALGAVMLDTKKQEIHEHCHPEPCDVCENLEEGDTLYSRSEWDGGIRDYISDIKFCPKCGRRL